MEMCKNLNNIISIYNNFNIFLLIRYEGEFHEEKRHGKGIHYHLCGSKYDG